MITYDFYTQEFKGSSIPSSSFDVFIRRAQRYVEKCLKVYTIYNTEEEIMALKDFCICDIADSLYNYESTLGTGIKQESDGQSSITYDTESNNSNSKVLATFGSYFDYYRGA
jgi:hypothetical protein